MRLFVNLPLRVDGDVTRESQQGVWPSDGSDEAIPALDAFQLMLVFRHHALKNLLACGRIGQATVGPEPITPLTLE